MSPTCIPLVKYQAAVGGQWLSTLLVIAGSYAAVMDPRPDLATPARSIKFPYTWWWQRKPPQVAGSWREMLEQAVLRGAFSGWQRVRVHALLVGDRIDLRALYRSDSLAVAPLAIPAGERGMAVLFRYGAVVMFNLQVVEEAAFLVSLKSVVGETHADPEREEADIVVDPAAGERVDAGGVIHLREVTPERLLVVADVLAKSVVLAYDEQRVARVFDRIEPVAAALQRRGSGRIAARQLLHHIGDVLITQHRMVGRVEVTEKPELLWDRPELERLYLRLQEEYELPERDRALTRKLDLIAQTATTALGLLQARRSLRVEWYIVILIVIEIILTLYQMFVATTA